MNEIKGYTPGPWEVAIDLGRHIITRRSGHTIALISKLNMFFEGEVPANARLIAAAPELLEVIREAVDSAEREMAKGRKASPGLATWLEKARAVLAKVRGEKSE